MSLTNRVILGRPDPVDRPRVLGLRQDALVALLALHPLRAHSVRPMLGENQKVEVGVFAERHQSQLAFGLQFAFKVLATTKTDIFQITLLACV